MMKLNNISDGQQMNFLKNKNILITGSSRGIGKEMALFFSAQGANVCVHYQFSEQNARDVVDEIVTKYKSKAFAIQADLQKPSEIQDMFSVLKEQWTSLDGLVINAASGNRKKLIDQTVEDWNRISGINVLSAIQCVKQALPLFHGRFGRVIFLSSEGARFGIQKYGAIGVTKAALEAVMRQLTVELKNETLAINTVSATLVKTSALDAVTKGTMDQYADFYFIDPIELASLVSFLISDLCPQSLRSQTICLDNGSTSEFAPFTKKMLEVLDSGS